MNEPRAVVLAVAAGAAALAAACAEVSTEPSAIVSLAFDTSAVAVVAGDTLRDTLGGVQPLRAVAFNASDDTVTGATLAYVLAPADTGPARLVGPLVIGVQPRSTPVRIFATVGELQSLPKSVDVIRAPAGLARVTGADSARYTAPARAGQGALSIAVAQARVNGDSSGTAVGVRRVVVRFAVERAAPSIADSVQIIDPRTPRFDVSPAFIPRSPLDTSESNGDVGRRVLVYLRAGAAARDTVVLRATFAHPAAYPGATLAADTVRIAIPVVPGAP